MCQYLMYKLKADYCYDTLTHIKFKKPKEEEVVEHDEKPEVYDLDWGLQILTNSSTGIYKAF